jgi:hypothetical protein
MRFFFPDSQDAVDPSFDFERETRDEFRIRVRDDLYAHEIFEDPPFDGVLVSKAIVEGTSGKYSLAQRHRLYRIGIRSFLRLDRPGRSRRLETLGDCGAFSYVREEKPPFSVEDVLNFYEQCGFDHGISVDHVILSFHSEKQQLEFGRSAAEAEEIMQCRQRQQLTLLLAQEFLNLHQRQGCRFTPIGVAQGWSAASYAEAVEDLQKMGYRRIAVGGMVPLKTPDILASLEAISTVRRLDTELHLLGVTRCDHVERFQQYGVTSFDSTMPLMQAFKDEKDNYHTLQRTYTAVRVPQVQANPKLLRQIKAGQVDQQEARRLEQACMAALRRYDRDEIPVEAVLEPLRAYEILYDGRKDRTQVYRETLGARPWRECSCDVCRALGIQVVIFRGSERNKRRGFHNLTVLYARLHRELGWCEADMLSLAAH